MIRDTRPGSRATDPRLTRFRHLAVVAMLAGATAGLVLFAIQHWTIVPLIDRAELLEAAAHQAAPSHAHEDEGWQPAPGFERIGLTAATTILSGIGFGGILLAAMTISGRRLGWWPGVLWGLAGFVCFVLAPSLGLPPKPPGAAVGLLPARQLWWLATVISTAVGLWLVLGQGRIRRVAGVVLLLLPHAVGAPGTAEASAVPDDLMRSFALISVLTNLVFWLVLGVLCGFLRRHQLDRVAATAGYRQAAGAAG